MKKLYTNLLRLSANDATPFFFAEARWKNEFYRIFSYHFTDRDSWLEPSALESRGIMFEVTESGDFVRIASRPMMKFFNKGEVSFIDYKEIDFVMNKADGSLISSYLTGDGELRLKSKTSIHSEYAQLAMNLMNEEADLYEWILKAEQSGYTVNLELVSPDPNFRIVLYYDHDHLIILNARHRETGEYLDMREIPKKYFTGIITPEQMIAMLSEI